MEVQPFNKIYERFFKFSKIKNFFLKPDKQNYFIKKGLKKGGK